MSNKSRATTVLLLITTFFFWSSAANAEVPVLKWERGLVQEVVLGGVAATNNWKLELQGNGIEALKFTESSKSKENFIVFSVMIPESAPIGSYILSAIKPGGEVKVIAGVNLIGVEKTKSYRVTQVPRDLLAIIGILVFLTGVASTLRARKYSELHFICTQRLYDPFENRPLREVLGQKIKSAPYAMRIKAITGFNTSVFKFFILREGELIHRISPQLYSFMPIIGFIGGAIAANESQKAGGIALATLLVFIAMALIGIVDAFSGAMAILGFWFVELASGNITSFRDILLMFAVAISWLGPILAATLFQNVLPRDFSRSANPPSAIGKLIGILSGSVFGASIFYLGQKLVNSVLIEINVQREISVLALGIIAASLVIRGLLDMSVVEKAPSGKNSEKYPAESLSIARVNSPQTATVVFAMVFGFTYLWTQSSQDSLMIAALFSAPYFLLLIRFNKFKIKFLARIPRNILIESSLITAAAFVIFEQVSTLPLLSDDRATRFLVLAGCPGIIHAIISNACDSASRAEILQS